MSKKIQFYTKHPNKPRCGVEHTIHQDSELYILWYYLYRIDKIILSNNNYEKPHISYKNHWINMII